MGDRFGRRRVFGAGAALFALASIWCGVAPGVGQLIIARAAQGVGGALLIPGSLAILSASFPEERRGTASGTWSGFTAITAAIGPGIGGWLIGHVSWLFRSRNFDGANLLNDETRVELKKTIDESFIFGFRLVMTAAVALALASALSAFMMIEGNVAPRTASTLQNP